MSFLEKDPKFRPDQFDIGLYALCAKLLARPIDQPSPRRVEPRDAAKVENSPPRRASFGQKGFGAGFDRSRGIQSPVPGETKPHGVAVSLARKCWTVQHIHPSSPPCDLIMRA